MLPLAHVAVLAKAEQADWLTTHATLIVGVVGIVVSGFLGPSITAWWTSRRERQKDRRALIVARREDLRGILDETAKILGGAVTKLRPLLDAQLNRKELPTEPVEFLGSLVPLGQRLSLRLPPGHDVVESYGTACVALHEIANAAGSQAEWDAAVTVFETRRSEFLDTGRVAVQAPVVEDQEI